MDYGAMFVGGFALVLLALIILVVVSQFFPPDPRSCL